jgi:hypothetical protein
MQVLHESADVSSVPPPQFESRKASSMVGVRTTVGPDEDEGEDKVADPDDTLSAAIEERSPFSSESACITWQLKRTL